MLVSHKSDAVGSMNSGTPGQSIGVTCVAQVIVGAMVSCTTMVALQVAVFRQSSVAVGGTNSGAAGQSIGVTCVAQVIVGAMVSCTTMVALQVEEFKQSSVAVHVLVTL